MSEFTGPAVVLSVRTASDLDVDASFFTRELGKVRGRAKSARKPESKLGPHLQVGNRLVLRLVHKNSTRIADALSQREELAEEAELKKFRCLSLLDSLLAYEQIEPAIWQLLEKGDYSTLKVLSVLGLDPKHARCVSCTASGLDYFYLPDHSYYCAQCSTKHRFLEGLYELF